MLNLNTKLLCGYVTGTSHKVQFESYDLPEVSVEEFLEHVKRINKKEMKNYKIKTEGRNEEILAKAKELGYDWTHYDNHRSAQYIVLESSGNIYMCVGKYTYDHQEAEEISVNDFLRLNWEPKVGEKFYDTEVNKERVIERVTQGMSVRFNRGSYSWDYFIEHCIPIYPKEAKKPDAYCPNFHTIVFMEPGGNEVTLGFGNADLMLGTLPKYNLLLVDEYNRRYHGTKRYTDMDMIDFAKYARSYESPDNVETALSFWKAENNK